MYVIYVDDYMLSKYGYFKNLKENPDFVKRYVGIRAVHPNLVGLSRAKTWKSQSGAKKYADKLSERLEKVQYIQGIYDTNRYKHVRTCRIIVIDLESQENVHIIELASWFTDS